MHHHGRILFSLKDFLLFVDLTFTLLREHKFSKHLHYYKLYNA